MRFLDQLEGLLEELIEGVFGRKSEDLPASILRRLADELERRGRAEGGSRWAPSEYHVVLTREAMRLILPIQAELEEELQHALVRVADRFGLAFPGPIRFRFGVGDGAGIDVLSVKG
ncbi:MAG: DUF3662 domain-containing protein, partial [Firmicutes bacterium]|nr:DUF3662 domain-containing protein [Bacillota bacterium]